jgi:hypothetical protein
VIAVGIHHEEIQRKSNHHAGNVRRKKMLTLHRKASKSYEHMNSKVQKMRKKYH